MTTLDRDPELVAGRSCESCTMCCKLLAVAELDKPRGTWCTHCDQKRGCMTYETRPGPCRGFYCGYRRLEQLDERWKPSKAKFLVNFEEASNRIVIHADASRPDAWRAEPFYKTIKNWARNAAKEHGTVLVWAGNRATLVLPGSEKEFGEARDDMMIVAVERRTPHGIEIDYELVEPNSPRAASQLAPPK